MIVFLGIDDTDNATSRGTGYQARRLGEALTARRLAILRAITRHQLLVDPQIPYTSHNSSACLVLDAAEGSISDLRDFVVRELGSHSAAGSNVGICIATHHVIDRSVEDFGHAAKRKVLSEETAHKLARDRGIILEGLTGSGAGVIGALAAVGLHKSGEDGRFIWLPGLRELSDTYTVRDLTRLLGVDIMSQSGEAPPTTAEINIGEWVRPVLRQGRAILLVEEAEQDDKICWRLIDKSIVKDLSS